MSALGILAFVLEGKPSLLTDCCKNRRMAFKPIDTKAVSA